jgi:hypothetical protein
MNNNKNFIYFTRAAEVIHLFFSYSLPSFSFSMLLKVKLEQMHTMRAEQLKRALNELINNNNERLD